MERETSRPRTSDYEAREDDEMTDAELDAMRPASEALPPEVFATLTALPGSSTSAAGQTTVALALDQDVVAAFQATGNGWRARINDVLRREMVALARME